VIVDITTERLKTNFYFRASVEEFFESKQIDSKFALELATRGVAGWEAAESKGWKIR
jgi:hypothetical protein